jgi:hypothetical protein
LKPALEHLETMRTPFWARKVAPLEQSTILTLVGVVLALVFVLQETTGGWRRAVPKLIGLALLVAAIGGYLVYRHRQRAIEVHELAARRAEFDSRLSQFAARYNAVTDWQKSLLGVPDTSELAPLLVRADGRSILVVASLLSLSEIEGQTVVYFDAADRPESRFKLQLDCSSAQAHSLVSDGGPYFAVIARIRSLDYIGNNSLARGRCIDLMPVSLSDYLELVVGPELEKHAPQGG